MYNIMTKDGIVVTDIPDDVPKDDPRLKALVAQLRAAGQKSATFADTQPAAAPQPAAPAAPPQEAIPDMNPRVAALEKMMGYGDQPKTDPIGLMGAAVRGAGPVALGTAVGAGIGSVVPGVGTVAGGAAGGGAMALSQFVGDPLVEAINGLLGTQLTKPTDALMQLFTALGVPEPDTAAERIVQAASAGGAGAAGTALLGQALSKGATQLAPSVAKALGDALSAGMAQQVTGGIGSGLAGQGAAEAGAGPVAQVGASLAGGVLGSALGGLRPAPSKLSQAPLDEAAAAGVRVLPGDVSPKTGFARWVQRRVDELPFGPGGLRARQAAERQAAVRDVIRQFGADDLAAASGEVMDDLRATHGAALQKWTSAKTEVIDRLAGASGQVPMAATLAKIDDSIATLKGMKTKEVQKVIDVLTDWRQAVQGQDLANIELLRKQIGDVFTAPEMGSVRSTAEKVLSGIYGAVNEDMGNFIKTAGKPEDFTKWKVANTELAKMMKELERPALKVAIDKGAETPEYISNLLFSRKRSDVEALYRGLSPDGKAAARAAVLAKAAGEAGEAVSPDKFAASLKKMGDQVGVMFSGEDLKRVEGLQRVLEFTKQASSATAMPPTGVQLTPYATYAATAGTLAKLMHLPTEQALVGGAVALGGAAGLTRAYSEAYSAAMRNPEVYTLLAKIPALKPGSPDQFAFMKRLVSALQVAQQKPDVPVKPKTTERAGTLYAK